MALRQRHTFLSSSATLCFSFSLTFTFFNCGVHNMCPNAHASRSKKFDGIVFIVNVLISANRLFIHQTDTIILWITINDSIFLVSRGYFFFLILFDFSSSPSIALIKREKSFPQNYRNVFAMKIIARWINIKNVKNRNKFRQEMWKT